MNAYNLQTVLLENWFNQMVMFCARNLYIR
jgi:hypothetical protein